MTKKIIISILFFYLLSLLQVSFFVHFFDYMPNLVLMAVVFINIFEDRKDSFGIFSSLVGGFFLDVFSEKFIGYYIIISLLLAMFFKSVLNRYIGGLQKVVSF